MIFVVSIFFSIGFAFSIWNKLTIYSSNEEFWFNEAWLLSGFDFKGFVKLLKEGTILVDIRIGQYKDGRTHDHGTGFRVFPAKLDLCFSYRQRII